MRITSQYVEVAGRNTDGNLNITKISASVLAQRLLTTTFTESINHAISFTQSGRNSYHQMRVSDPISFSSVLARLLEKEESVEHSLGLTQLAQRATPCDANSVLTFVDTVEEFNLVEDRKGASNTLNLVQTVVCLSALAVEDTLNFTQLAEVRFPFSEYVEHHIYFNQGLPTPHRLWVEDEVTFTQYGKVPITQNITSAITFTSIASVTNYYDTLALTQTVSVGKGKDVEDELGITDTVFVQAYWNRLVTQNLGIGHAITWYNIAPCTPKNYSPFQGENTVMTEFAQPSDTLPSTYADPSTDRMVLYYPSTLAIAKSLTLRAPEMDNRERSQHTRVSRETRGGSLIVYADPTWPTVRTLAVTITGATANKVDEYVDFVQNTLGKEIDLRDWDGYLWRGVITDSENPISTDGIERCTIAFEFEGVRVDSDNPEDGIDGYSLDLTDEATCVLEPAP